MAAMAFGTATASADHFEPNSKKECGARNPSTNQLSCTLTIAINDDGPGLPPGDVITVELGPGATYDSATVTGGTCAGTVNLTSTAKQLRVDPQHPGFLDDCTIIVEEVLTVNPLSTQVCQRLDSPANDPPFIVCARVLAPPTSAEQCKNGGFQTYRLFKNQGDCVAFVETEGKNEPGQNQPNQP